MLELLELLNANRNSNKIGISVKIEIVAFFSNALMKFVKSTSPLVPLPKMKNAIKAIMKAGTVVQSMLRICSNKSTPVTAGARFVVSDKGDILSPKNAPEIIAPAIRAGSYPRALPMPIKASPTVAAVVKALPILVPTIAQTTKTVGMKIFGDTSWKPYTIKVGIVPAAIQTLINTPTSKNIK